MYRIECKLFFLLSVFWLGLSSCRKDKPEDFVQPIPVISNNGGVYITNEGNFQFGNAKISYYDFESGVSTEDLFKPANNRPLGDVCQSMCFFNRKAYLIINNSNKIEVVDPKSFVVSSTITGLVSPRYFLPVSNNKAYVTDFKANAISIIDLNNNVVTGNIPCFGWTEELVLAYGKVFIVNHNSNKVYVINTLTDAINDSISVGYASNSIREDKNGKLWVTCSGNPANNIFPTIHRINPINNQVELSITFANLSDNPYKLDINGSLDVLYYIADAGVYQLPITATTISSFPLIPKGSYNFYGIGIDPNDGTIYVADAVDYVQRGVILRYQSNGTFIDSFTAGIIPGDFYFN
ncbi:MAG: DUF5074 domain-containing protein [Bacteroidota bacterium]